MVRMKDVAEHAGVSIATVSNVITGKNYVSPEVKQKVEESVHHLGYKVNLLARGLKIKRTRSIGVILPDITKMFFPNVLRGIETAAKKYNYKVNFLTSDFDFAVERESVEYLKSSCVDGIIIDSCCEPRHFASWSEELVREDHEGTRFPVVSMEQVMDRAKISSVLVDYVQLSKSGATHLIEQGKRNIIYIKAGMMLAHGQQRFEGYKDALQAHGIPLREELVLDADFSALSAYHVIKQALAKGVEFDAVQAINDQAAIGALKALHEADIRVPQQVAVVGCDNIFPGTLVSPQITTIDIPKYELGYTAFEELMRLMEETDEPALPRSVMLEAALIVRQSTVVECPGEWNLSMW